MERCSRAAYEGQAYAMLGAARAMKISHWLSAIGDWGLSAWDFGYSQRVQPPHTEIYMYTDRPIYRPGQTVYFRGVARQAFNGRYELPPVNTIPLTLRDANGIAACQLRCCSFPHMAHSTVNLHCRRRRCRDITSLRTARSNFIFPSRLRNIASQRST